MAIETWIMASGRSRLAILRSSDYFFLKIKAAFPGNP